MPKQPLIPHRSAVRSLKLSFTSDGSLPSRYLSMLSRYRKTDEIGGGGEKEEKGRIDNQITRLLLCGESGSYIFIANQGPKK